MSSRWVPDYPNAASQRDIYANVVNSLTAQRPSIDAAASVYVLPINNYTDTTSTLEGDYYDEYDIKASEWQKENSRINKEFQIFLHELDTRITIAEGKRNMWAQRIYMGHYEEEDD